MYTDHECPVSTAGMHDRGCIEQTSENSTAAATPNTLSSETPNSTVTPDTASPWFQNSTIAIIAGVVAVVLIMAVLVFGIAVLIFMWKSCCGKQLPTQNMYTSE